MLEKFAPAIKDRFVLLCDKLPMETRVVGLSGLEGLSQPYRFTLEVLMPEEVGLNFEMEEALSAHAVLTMMDGRGALRSMYHGILAAMEWGRELAERVLYKLVLVPRLWQLGLNQHSAIYVDKTVISIINNVMKRNGFFEGRHYEFWLEPTRYEPLPHVSQYRESDLAFIQRRMEREGLYYFFAQSEEGEKLIITDTLGSHKANSSLRYLHRFNRSSVGFEALTSFTCRRQVRPERVKLSGFDYLRPAMSLSLEKAVSRSGQGCISSHDENYITHTEGQRLARVRAEELKAQESLFEGCGHFFGVQPGYIFELTDHPRFDGKYLAIKVEHEVRGTGIGGQGLPEDASEPGYSVRVEAIPAKVQYRPGCVTPVPRIYGTELGIVEGEQNSDYAQIDEHGRYKVRLLFSNDSNKGASKCSTWVRMLQPHAGSAAGFHFPLRKGTEVMLVFLGGDPDRPVIAGAVPNGLSPSPVTQHNASQNVILTGGSNLLEMEDAEGAQYIRLRTPAEETLLHLGAKDCSGHNVHLDSKGNALIHLGQKLDIEVDGHKYEHVRCDSVETCDQDQNTTVGKNRSLTVCESDSAVSREQHVETRQGRSIKVGTDQRHEISGNDELAVNGGQSVQVRGCQDIRASSRRESITGSLSQTCGSQDITVTGAVTTNIAGSFSQAIAGGAMITSPAGYRVISPDWFKVSTKSGELVSQKINIASELKIDAGTCKIDMTGIKLDYAKIKINNNPLTMEQCRNSIKNAVVGVCMYGLTVIG